jgi:hypothetical protein
MLCKRKHVFKMLVILWDFPNTFHRFFFLSFMMLEIVRTIVIGYETDMI